MKVISKEALKEMFKQGVNVYDGKCTVKQILDNIDSLPTLNTSMPMSEKTFCDLEIPKLILDELNHYRYQHRIPQHTGMIVADVVEDFTCIIQKYVSSNGWILCSDKLPENEQEVIISCKRKNWNSDKFVYFTARGFYENGKIDVDESNFDWSESNCTEYNEETDKCTVIKGWYEALSFSETFNDVDCEVLAWKPLPEPYTETGFRLE